MRSLAKFTRLLPLLLILLFACQSDEEVFNEFDPEQQEIENFIADGEYRIMDVSARTAEDMLPCAEPVVFPILYQRHNEVGKATIWNTEESLMVNYEITPGIELEKTMLVVVMEKKGNINTKKIFDPKKYKKLIYSIPHDSDMSGFLYEIPFSELDPDSECVSIIAIAKCRYKNGVYSRRSMYSFARKNTKEKKKGFNEFLIEYCMQSCGVDTDPEENSCEVACISGFGTPSVDVGKSYTFEELGINDWPWGYVHEINNETLFRLPVKFEDSENAAVIGQVTVMIEGGMAYVYFQMDEAYPMYKSMLYISAEKPGSGIPCTYNLSREYLNTDGTWNPMTTDIYEISNLNDFRDSNRKFNIVTYVDFCE